MTRDCVRPLRLFEAVVDRVAERLVGRAACREERQHALPLHVGGNRHARRREEGRREIKILHQRVRRRRCGNLSRPTHDERHAETLFVHPTLVEPTVLAKEPALIACVDDDRVVREAESVEFFEDAADRVIDALRGAQVVLRVSLESPFRERLRLHARVALNEFPILIAICLHDRALDFARNPLDFALHPRIKSVELAIGKELARGDFQVVLPREITVDLHRLHRTRATATFVTIEERRRKRNLVVFEEVQMSRCRHPVAVRRFVMNKHRERLAILRRGREHTQSLERVRMNDVGCMPVTFRARAINDERRIPIVALPDEDIPVIEARRIAF